MSRIECFQCALGDALGRAQLTNSAASPLAHETLLFTVASPSFLPSVAPGLALAEGLVGLLDSRAGKAVVRRIDEGERQLFDAGAYRPVPRGG